MSSWSIIACDWVDISFDKFKIEAFTATESSEVFSRHLTRVIARRVFNIFVKIRCGGIAMYFVK
jgi:hypothetical protein